MLLYYEKYPYVQNKDPRINNDDSQSFHHALNDHDDQLYKKVISSRTLNRASHCDLNTADYLHINYAKSRRYLQMLMAKKEETDV